LFDKDNAKGSYFISGHAAQYPYRSVVVVVGELLEGDGEQSTVTVEARLYDLWPFTNISARVAVLNSKFEGPSTSVVTFTTDEGGKVDVSCRISFFHYYWVLQSQKQLNI